MPIYRCQVSLAAPSGVAEDRIVNTFHVSTSIPPLSNEWASLESCFTTFYQTIDQYLAADFVNTTGHTFKIYNLSDPTPRVPVYEGSLGTLSGLIAAGMPPEVALCLSYRGQYQSGGNPQRRRGRVYIGPIGYNTTTTIDTDGRPHSTLVSGLATAGDTLFEAIYALNWTDNQVGPVVYSPTAEDAFPVIALWVDNEWDHQRSRGRQATSRSSLSVSMG